MRLAVIGSTNGTDLVPIVERYKLRGAFGQCGGCHFKQRAFWDSKKAGSYGIEVILFVIKIKNVMFLT